MVMLSRVTPQEDVMLSFFKTMDEARKALEHRVNKKFQKDLQKGRSLFLDMSQTNKGKVLLQTQDDTGKKESVTWTLKTIPDSTCPWNVGSPSSEG